MPVRARSLVLLLGIAFGLGQACPGPAAAQSCLCGTIADEFVAGRVGLVREWIVQIPFDSAGWKLEHVVAGDGLVVAQSGDGVVAAVRAGPAAAGAPRPGTLLWSHRLGTPGGPTAPAGIGSGLVTVVRDLGLIALDAETGVVAWERGLGGPPLGGATPNGDWVYVPTRGGKLLRLAVNPETPPVKALAIGGGGDRESSDVPEKRDPRSISTEGRLGATPLAYRDGVLWWNTSGTLVTLFRDTQGWRRHEFQLAGPVAGSPAVADKTIYVATTNGDLVKIVHERTGLRAMWRTTLGAVPAGGPLLAGDTLVVGLGADGVAAFSATSGVQLWQVPRMDRLLAIVGDRVWCHDAVGRLTALDLGTGLVREHVCIGCFTHSVVGGGPDHLVLASPRGLVASFRPRQAAMPAAPAAEAPAAEGQDGKAEPPAEEPGAEPAVEPADGEAGDAA